MGTRTGRYVGVAVAATMLAGFALLAGWVGAEDGGNLIFVDRSKITPELRAEWRANKGKRSYKPSASITSRYDGEVDRGPADPLIQYDSGTPDMRSDLTGGYSIGNRFDVDAAGGPIQAGKTVSTVYVSLGGLFGNGAWLTFWGPVTTAGPGTQAPVLSSFVFGDATTPAVNGMNTLVVSPPLTGGAASFMIGVFNSTSSFCSGSTSVGSTCEGVALDNTTGGVGGFHGFQMIWHATNGTAFAPLAAQNAIIRPRGANLPVELMRATVE